MTSETIRKDDSSAQSFFDEMSGKYVRETFSDGCSSSTLGRLGRTNQVLRLLDKHLNGSVTILDIGCGPGQFAGPLANRGHTYVGMDINESMFVDAVAHYAEEVRVSFRQGRVEDIPMEDERADAVICIGVVEYIPEDVVALKEIARVLKKGGLAIITFPNIRYPLSLLRVALRPVLGPILRMCIPRLRETVYASGITHRTLRPGAFISKSKASGFEVVEQLSDGFLSLFNHTVGPIERRIGQWCDQWGRRLFPRCGSNYYVCLRKK